MGARAHTQANTPQGVTGRSPHPDPSTHAHTAQRNRKRRGAGGSARNHARPISPTTKGGV